MEFSRRQGADHGRRRAAQGQDGAGQGRPSTTVGDAGGDDVRGAPHRASTCPMGDGRRLLGRGAGGGRRGVPAAAELDAEHPLFILYSSGSTAKPKGILHSTGGYLTQVAWTHKHVFDLKPESDVYWCSADVGWITGHTYIVYGPLLNAATSVMYEGAPDYPHKGIWWELCRAATEATIFYTAPTAIRACMKWGAEHVEKARPVAAAAAGVGRRADQPQGLALVLEGRRRRQLPGRRHVVADRDRRDHDHHACPGAQAMKPGIAGTPLPGVERGGARRGGRGGRARHPGLVVAVGGRGRACCARCTSDDDRYVCRPTGKSGDRDDLPGRRRLQAGRRGLRLGHRPRRRRAQREAGTGCRRPRSRSAIVSHGKVAEAAVIGAHR